MRIGVASDEIVLVSGGFDPYHDGHAEYIHKASAFGPVVVALNSDSWLVNKKGAAFMPWEARKRVLLSVRGVESVYPVKDEDGTVCEAIRTLRPRIFAKGGDRGIDNTPEVSLCEQLGVKLMFGLGDKIRSSSELVERQWGDYRVIHEDENFKVKILRLKPGKATSLQYHLLRNEHWIDVDGDRHQFYKAGMTHRLENRGAKDRIVVEVQTGSYFGEDDIVRLGEDGVTP